MRIYGWQGGIHMEPETEEEVELCKQVLTMLSKGQFVFGSGSEFPPSWPPLSDDLVDSKVVDGAENSL